MIFWSHIDKIAIVPLPQIWLDMILSIIQTHIVLAEVETGFQSFRKALVGLGSLGVDA